jgi:hypothetical protein
LHKTIPPRIRLLIWIAAVFVTLAAQTTLIWARRSDRPSVPTLTGVCVAGLIGIVALLLTTPPNSIRLRRLTSESVIFIISLLLASADGLTLGCIRIALTVIALIITRATGKSAWWAVPLSWFPS